MIYIAFCQRIWRFQNWFPWKESVCPTNLVVVTSAHHLLLNSVPPSLRVVCWLVDLSCPLLFYSPPILDDKWDVKGQQTQGKLDHCPTKLNDTDLGCQNFVGNIFHFSFSHFQLCFFFHQWMKSTGKAHDQKSVAFSILSLSSEMNFSLVSFRLLQVLWFMKSSIRSCMFELYFSAQPLLE